MCFIVSVSVPKDAGPEVERRLVGVGPLQLKATSGGLFSKRFYVQISEDGTCGCSMLDENVGTNPEVCRIRPDLLQPLADTVLALAKVLPKEIEFQAMWIGDKPKHVQQAQLSELIEAICQNQLREKTTYQVSS